MDRLERIRQQFDFHPYPSFPIEQSPRTGANANQLFIHNAIAPFYLRYQEVIEYRERVILDAGCGTGYKTLSLAEANPGAKIIGIDVSPESIERARERLAYHGFDEVEFFALNLEEVASLGVKFDYINCDEVLYLLEDPVSVLKAFKSALAAKGIIRANFHSYLQRLPYYRAQEAFGMMGLLDENPEELEIEAAIATLKALKPKINLRAQVWNDRDETGDIRGKVLANYLLQGDRGYTIPEMFGILEAAELEFICMVNWRHWEPLDLFRDRSSIPDFLEVGLQEAPIEERLHFYELLHPQHRLLDFWCAVPTETAVKQSWQWQDREWFEAKVHLHPQLKTQKVKEELVTCATVRKPFEISRTLPLTTISPLRIESQVAACLLPLWEEAQPFSALVHRWQQIQSRNPITLEAIDERVAFSEIKAVIQQLEACLYVLLESGK